MVRTITWKTKRKVKKGQKMCIRKNQIRKKASPSHARKLTTPLMLPAGK